MTHNMPSEGTQGSSRIAPKGSGKGREGVPARGDGAARRRGFHCNPGQTLELPANEIIQRAGHRREHNGHHHDRQQRLPDAEVHSDVRGGPGENGRLRERPGVCSRWSRAPPQGQTGYPQRIRRSNGTGIGSSADRANRIVRLRCRTRNHSRCAAGRERMLLLQLPEALGQLVHLHRILSQRVCSDRRGDARIPRVACFRPLAPSIVLRRLWRAGHLAPGSIPYSHWSSGRMLLGSGLSSAGRILLGHAPTPVGA